VVITGKVHRLDEFNFCAPGITVPFFQLGSGGWEVHGGEIALLRKFVLIEICGGRWSHDLSQRKECTLTSSSLTNVLWEQNERYHDSA
jgi:hypothetical protein